MRGGRAVIWVLLTASVVGIAGVQLEHQGYLSFKKKFPFVSWGAPSRAKHHVKHRERVTDKKGVVCVFGHEFKETAVRQWFQKVEGRYCYKEGIVYAAGTAPGYPLTYDQFVCALKLGYHFPELKGEGIQSDGEQTILVHESPFAKEKTRRTKVTTKPR